MENAEVLKLIKQGESETVEFKKSTSEIKEATISIASILNKHMKGDLFFGIANDGRIYGQTIGKDTLPVIPTTKIPITACIGPSLDLNR